VLPLNKTPVLTDEVFIVTAVILEAVRFVVLNIKVETFTAMAVFVVKEPVLRVEANRKVVLKFCGIGLAVEI